MRLLAALSAAVAHAAARRPDVVFFYIDDMRPETGFFHDPLAVTPNLDNLAADGTVLERCYTMLADCSPSRTALLTSRRPDTTKVWDSSKEEYWREVPGGTNATTLPEMLKANGYITVGGGKVFHPGAPSGNDDERFSWSPEGLPYYHSPLESQYGPGNRTALSWPYQGFDDDDLPDGQIAGHAKRQLRAIQAAREAGDDRPFALFVGFHKPHTPLFFPAKYWDMTEDDTLPLHRAAAVNAPPIAPNSWGGMHRYNDVAAQFPDKDLMEQCYKNASVGLVDPRCQMGEALTRKTRHAYRAAIAYTDAQIGRVVAQLKDSGFYDEAVVAVTSDHGWSLGEGQSWAKFEVTERATAVVALFKLPGAPPGNRVSSLVEQVDFFPTVAEAVGLSMPLCPSIDKGGRAVPLCTEGVSFLPLVRGGDRAGGWKSAAFQQYPRPNSGYHYLGDGWPAWPPQQDQAHKSQAAMGFALRSDEWRYVEWVGWNATTAEPLRDVRFGVELYNYTHTPVPLANFDFANVNLAGEPQYRDVVANLSQRLWAGWRHAMPPTKRDS